MKINNAVFLSYLLCPYKAGLLLGGRSGTQTDYGTLTAGLDRDYAPLARAAICHASGSVSIEKELTVNHFVAKDGPALILGARIEHGPFEFIVDALKRLPGEHSSSS